MHRQALNFFHDHLEHLPPLDVVEFGSCDMNGSVRIAYPQAKSWHGIDVQAGPNVDEIADCADWTAPKPVDVILCAEVFEHTPRWREIIANAHANLKPGGLFLASCATGRRPPHSAVDGGHLRPGEFYENVSAMAMSECRWGWSYFNVTPADGYFGGDDLYLKAMR